MQLEEVDPRGNEAFAAWFGVLGASLEDQRPGEAHRLPVEEVLGSRPDGGMSVWPGDLAGGPR